MRAIRFAWFDCSGSVPPAGNCRVRVCPLLNIVSGEPAICKLEDDFARLIRSRLEQIQHSDHG